MTLKTSCFDKTVFFKTLKRFWPLWAGYLVIWLIAMPMSIYDSGNFYGYLSTAKVQREVLEFAVSYAPLLSFLFAPLAAMAVFSYLYNDKSCGFYASLPVKRETMFLSTLLAGLVPLLLSNVLVFGATLLAELAIGYLEVTAALTWLAVSSMELVTFYGLAVLCTQLTGHTLVVPALYILLSFTGVVVEFLLQALCSLFLYGYTYSELYLSWLSPLVMLLRHVGTGAKEALSVTGSPVTEAYYLDGWGLIGSYTAVSIGFLVLSFFLYRKRVMETAGDVVAVKRLRPVFKYCFAAGCALVLGLMLAGMFYYDVTGTLFGLPIYGGLLITCLLGGTVGYFAAEMLNQKSFRVFSSAWKGFIVFSLAVVLGLSALEFDLFGFETRIPDKDKVRSVSLQVAGHSNSGESPEEIDSVISLQKALMALKDKELDTTWNLYYVQLDYTMKNGSVVSRSYPLPLTEETKSLAGRLEDHMNDPAFCEDKGFSQKNITPEWFEYATVYSAMENNDLALTQQEAYDFYMNYLLPDLQEGNISRFWILENSPYMETTYDCHIELVIHDPNADSDEHYRYNNLYLTLTTDSTRVLSYLQSQGYTPTPESK